MLLVFENEIGITNQAPTLKKGKSTHIPEWLLPEDHTFENFPENLLNPNSLKKLNTI